jgi:ribosome-associated protein
MASLAADKLATEIVILDMRDVVTYTDYFVICSGRNPRQTQAVADDISETLKRDGLRARRIEGHRQGDWILLDYLDVVVHVFTPEARGFYRLEALWGQVPSETYAAG